MILTARINDKKTYKLVRWDNREFRDNLTLTIQSIDILDIKNTFSNINKIEIFQDDVMVAAYTSFDTFNGINYLGTTYVEGEQTFVDAMSVTLTKTNIIDQVNRLDEKINPVIDTTRMSLEEYKKYKLGQLSEACTSSIYQGDQVMLSDGTMESFSFNDKDQVDLQSLSSLAMMNPEIELTWHSNGNPCKFYPAVDIILIYQTLNMKLFREVTICNAINMLINTATTKEEVDQYYWGCELPAEDQERVSLLISRMAAIVEEIVRKFMPTETPSSEVDNGGENNVENTEEN